MTKPNNPLSAADIRRKELAAIHAAKRDLAMDDDVYRNLLEDIADVRSAASLDAKGRKAVLNRLRELGWQRKTSPKHKGKPGTIGKHPELLKIEAQLADMKLPWAYVDAIAKRQFGIEKVAWIQKRDQFTAIIAALHVEQEKRSLLAALTEACANAGQSLDEIASQHKLRGNWQRNRLTLRKLLQLYTGQ
jgi:phage gp16-like protein